MEAPLRPRRVHRLVSHLADFGKLALGEPQDAFGIVGAGDLLRHPRLVVAHVGPAEDVVEHRVLEELAAEIDCARGLVRIDDHGLAVGCHLGAAIGPQQRVEPAVVVAEAVAEFEAEGMILGFQLLADLVELVPGLRKLLDADFGEPVGAPVHQLTDIAEGDCLPFAVHDNGLPAGVVPAALRLADLVGDVVNVEIFVAELDHVEQDVHRDVGARPGLGNRADPCRQAADAGHLVVDLDAGLLLVGRGKRVHHIFVERLDERAFVEDRDGLLCRGCREGPAQRCRGACGRKLEESPPCRRVIGDQLCHTMSSLRQLSGGLAARVFAC